MEHHNKKTEINQSAHDMANMHHSGNPKMGMEGHDHSLMIADFKKRFYALPAAERN